MQAGLEAPVPAAARLPLNRTEWTCVAVAVIVAHAFLLHTCLFPSAWDAAQYLTIGRDFAEHGLFRKFEGSDLRSYGYPFVLSVVVRAAAWTGLSFVALVFLLQFIAYGAAAFFVRAALAPFSPLAARIAFCGMLVNYYVLIYTPETLTESVSLTLLVFAAGFWVSLWRNGLAAWPLFAGSFIVGFALVVRPANLFMVAAWVFGIVIIAWRRRPVARHVAIHAAILLVALLLPMTPQIRNNFVHYGKMTPLVTADIGTFQQLVGILNVKYATAMPPVPQPSVYYNNPFYEGSNLLEAPPWSWYSSHPLRGIATVALHTFNLTDQDLLFTYSRDLTPWYRVPLGIVNHAAVALGLLGLILLGRQLRTAGEPRGRDAYVVLLAVLVSNWTLYAWTAVEMRFGSVLLLILFPLAAYALTRVMAARSLRMTAAVALGTAAYVVLALTLSAWVRDQAPLIREARALPPPVGSPVPLGLTSRGRGGATRPFA
jgi:hypothetical protein